MKVIMNMNYSYPTTMYESILAHVNVFLVFFFFFFFFTFLAFYHENDFKQKLQKKNKKKKKKSTRIVYIQVKILSHILVK